MATLKIIQCFQFVIFFIIAISKIAVANDCNQRATKYGFVCVCNSTNCDSIPEEEQLNSGHYQLYTTSKDNLGFSSTTGNFDNSTSITLESITIANLSATRQTIFGFGGAFTDATGINILRLSNDTQEKLLQSYFGGEGIQYSFGRVPIGGSDFSTRGYSYCDEQDETLETFELQNEDFEYKIPFIQEASELRGEGFKLFASAWTAPKWMKTSNSYNGFGKVKESDYSLWADYYIKFFDAYKENNITFWGVTTQNEPALGLLGSNIPNNGFTADKLKAWIKVLGAKIRNSSYSNLKIITHDDQELFIPGSISILNDKEAMNYIDGYGVHWYTDDFTPSSVLNLIQSSNKEIFKLATEACEGAASAYGLTTAVELGSWKRGGNYADSIIRYLSHGFIGWMDWNMALNETGGPNYIQNYVDSPIIVNGTADEFYKQPMFYALGHFSKFFIPGSVLIESKTIGLGLESIAARRPDEKIVVFVKNGLDLNKTVKINIGGSTKIHTFEKNSFTTMLYHE